jgi:hypothetical protein
MKAPMRSLNATFWIRSACAALLLAPAFAQRTTDFRARITGADGDRGLCTVEVDVDGSAEVEIRGDTGRLRTVSGASSTWLKLECNRPLPPNPVEFHFTGVDGRGSQLLLKEPKDNRGAALVRIDDPRPGRETYSFRVEWRGSGGPDVVNWHDQVDFRAKGDGYFRNFRGQDDLLSNCEVSINALGEVRVVFDTNHDFRLTLTGRLTRAERNHLTADMSGNGLGGVMQITLKGLDRVTEISMSSQGRDRYDLSWRR